MKKETRSEKMTRLYLKAAESKEELAATCEAMGMDARAHRHQREARKYRKQAAEEGKV